MVRPCWIHTVTISLKIIDIGRYHCIAIYIAQFCLKGPDNASQCVCDVAVFLKKGPDIAVKVKDQAAGEGESFYRFLCGLIKRENALQPGL